MLGANSIAILARVAAQIGEPDRAIAALEKVLSIPGHDRLILVPLTPALLRLDPMFDPLRNDPRFQNSARKSSRESARLACRNLFEHMLGRSRDDGKHFVVRADEELTPLSNWNQPSEGGPHA